MTARQGSTPNNQVSASVAGGGGAGLEIRPRGGGCGVQPAHLTHPGEG